MIDIRKIQLQPLRKRQHDLDLMVIKPLSTKRDVDGTLVKVARKIVEAKQAGAATVFMMGAHILRSGVQRYIIDLLSRGYISCISTNGAGVIHDYEFSLIGATTECVAKYIRDGNFGMWTETGRINEIINKAFPDGPGLGEAVGRAILEGDFPYKDISLFAQAFKHNIPITVHVGIGFDIIHGHPNFDGAATGAASNKDFLTFAGIIRQIQNGVVMNFGSAVTAPEVFLKALSMARNIARQEGQSLNHFTTLVCDLLDLPSDYSVEAPKGSAAYYFRPWKTMLVRTVADGGTGYYVRGDHAETVPALWTAINMAEGLSPSGDNAK